MSTVSTSLTSPPGGPTELDRPDSGFTLVETLVALAIFALSFIAIEQGLATGFRAVGHAADQRAAIAAGRSLLAAAGVTTPLVPGVATGTTPDGIAYAIEIRPYEPEAGALRSPPSVPPAYWVTVRTGRAEAGVRARAEITTLMLGPRP